MNNKEMLNRLVETHLYSPRQAEQFVKAVENIEPLPEPVQRIHVLKFVQQLEQRIEVLKKRSGPKVAKKVERILWASLHKRIEKTEPQGQQDGRICKILWPSLQPEKGE